MSLTDDLARAIATFEGYFKPGTIAQRNNNPGNLRRWGNLPVKEGVPVDQPLNGEPPGGPTSGPPVSQPAGRKA